MGKDLASACGQRGQATCLSTASSLAVLPAPSAGRPADRVLGQDVTWSWRPHHGTRNVVAADALAEFRGGARVQGRAVVAAAGAEPPVPADVVGLVPVPA